MLIGIHVPDGNYAYQKAALNGNLDVARIFPDGMPVDVTQVSPDQFVSKVDAACAPVVAAGIIPFFSFKFMNEPISITNGGADNHLGALKSYLSTNSGQRYIASWHHEDEQTNISDNLFVVCNDYVYNRVKTDNLLFGPIYQGYPYESVPFRASRIPSKYDFLGIDVYSQDFMGKGYSLDKMKEMQTFVSVVGPNDPLYISERGITDGSESVPAWDPQLQADTLTADRVYLDQLPNEIVGYTYWDQHADPGKKAQYTLNSQAFAVYANWAADEHTTPPPPATPVQLTVSTNTNLTFVRCGVCAALLSNSASDAALHYQALHL